MHLMTEGEGLEVLQGGRVAAVVVENDQLVGIVTSYDFLEASAKLFKQHLTKAAGQSR